MAVAIGLWSLELKPGKLEVVEPQADLRITNVALGDVLEDKSGRSTVKFSYQVPGQSDDDEETSKEPTKTVLCSLTAGKLEQTITDIILNTDDEYTFEVIGQNPVYLTGNYIEQPSINEPPFQDSDDEDLEDAYDLREVSSDVEMDPAELDDLDSDASRFQEIEDEPPKSVKRAREADVLDGDAAKSLKADKKKMKGESGKAVAAPEVGGEKKEKKADKKKEKSEELEGKKDKPATAGAEREITGGIKILDSKTGTGPMAKKGNTVLMRYIGRLQNGKVFDKNVKGKPFTFHLGKGEVIKGWDEGIVGMQVGGERKLTIPPAMAYGKKGTDGIPKNSTLIFEVKLMEIKQ